MKIYTANLKNSKINNMKHPQEILNKCSEIIGQRGKEYSEEGFELDFEKIAQIFNLYSGKDLTSVDIAMIMNILKDVRFYNSPLLHEDSLYDAVNYSTFKAYEALRQKAKVKLRVKPKVKIPKTPKIALEPYEG